MKTSFPGAVSENQPSFSLLLASPRTRAPALNPVAPRDAVAGTTPEHAPISTITSNAQGMFAVPGKTISIISGNFLPSPNRRLFHEPSFSLLLSHNVSLTICKKSSCLSQILFSSSFQSCQISYRNSDLEDISHLSCCFSVSKLTVMTNLLQGLGKTLKAIMHRLGLFK